MRIKVLSLKVFVVFCTVYRRTCKNGAEVERATWEIHSNPSKEIRKKNASHDNIKVLKTSYHAHLAALTCTVVHRLPHAVCASHVWCIVLHLTPGLRWSNWGAGAGVYYCTVILEGSADSWRLRAGYRVFYTGCQHVVFREAGKREPFTEADKWPLHIQ